MIGKGRVSLLTAILGFIFLIIIVIWAIGLWKNDGSIISVTSKEPWQHGTKIEILYVYDGDTVQARDQSGEFDIRLMGMDAPEMSQPFGDMARDYLVKLLAGKEVRVSTFGLDKYERTLGLIYLTGDQREVCINRLMVEKGFAEAFISTVFSRDEWKARSQNLGMWVQGESYISPWVWRRDHE